MSRSVTSSPSGPNARGSRFADHSVPAGVGQLNRASSAGPRGEGLRPSGTSASGADPLRSDRYAGNRRVEDESGKEHQGVENLVVTEDGGHRVRAALAVDQGAE